MTMAINFDLIREIRAARSAARAWKKVAAKKRNAAEHAKRSLRSEAFSAKYMARRCESLEKALLRLIETTESISGERWAALQIARTRAILAVGVDATDGGDQ